MINLGLTRITALVAQLPTARTWKAIHIAGTNGKGSVAAYLSSLFLRLSRPADSSSELKIGRFTSPHLIDRWDCITINDLPVSESLFLKVEDEVKSYATKAADEVKKQKSHDGDEAETVTEFELLTATAFEIFSQQNCQVAIIECGLGGRLDATNVLKSQDVACSVITKIGLDHMGVLGNTVEAIAREKAGIVKRTIPMIIDGTNPHDVIESIAIVANSKNIAPTLSRQPEVEDVWGINREVAIGQIPPHQYNNLVLALNTFTQSQDRITNLQFTEPTAKILPQILTDMRTSYPARLQHLNITPLFPQYTTPILLDGAHNSQSAEVLKTYADSLSPQTTSNSTVSLPSNTTTTSFFRTRFTTKSRVEPKPRTWILAMSKGKETSKILNTLLETHDNVIVCHFSRVDGMPWITPMSPTQLAREARAIVEKGTVREASDVVEALSMAVDSCLARKVEREKERLEKDKKQVEKQTSKKAKKDHDHKHHKDHKDVNENTLNHDSDKEEIEIVVAGSLYLASDLLRAMRDGPESVKDRFDIGVAI